MIYYQHVYTDAETYCIREVSDFGTREPIDPLNIGYTDWISAGNTPEKIAGNPFVTINADGSVSYGTAGAQAAQAAQDLAALRGARNQKLKDTDWTQLSDSPLS